MNLKYADLTVGQEVAVSRSLGGWSIHNAGVYVVSKANKLKVVLQRVSDGYTREFSVKREAELGRYNGGRDAFIESVADMQRREARYAAERNRKQAWIDAEQAARDRNLDQLRAMVAKLEQFAQNG